MSIIRWGDAARVVIDGLTRGDAARVASRWCGSADSDVAETDGEMLRLEVPPMRGRPTGVAPTRVRLGMWAGSGGGSVELRVGSHAVVARKGSAPDEIRFAVGEAPSPVEHELLVDLGINHLLARQGLPVVHSCAFELGGESILGLGESYCGKTTVSVAAMRAGGRVVSDDLVLAVPGQSGAYSMLPVRSYGWLRGRTCEIVPGELREKMAENEEAGQPRWMLHREDGGEGFVDRSTPGIVWVQSVDRRLKESRIEPVDQGQVFAALIRASSPLYLSRHCPEIRDKLIPVFRSLCAQCRGFRVRLAPRLLEDPEGEMAMLIDRSR